MKMPTGSTLGAGLLMLALSLSACLRPNYTGLYQAGLPQGMTVDRLVVYKSLRLMEAWSDEMLVRTYAVAIGRGGAGPKRFEGDERTPEGEYRIDSRHRSAQFGLFLHVSYPNDRDWIAYRAGRRDGSILDGVGIGGAIGIHGERRGFGWLPHSLFGTAGCVMVDDDSAAELYEHVGTNAVIEIHP